MIRYIGDDLGANMGGMINWGDSKCPDQVILSDVVGDEVISMSLLNVGNDISKRPPLTSWRSRGVSTSGVTAQAMTGLKIPI